MKIKKTSWRIWMRLWQQQKRWESCSKTTQPTPAPPVGTQMVLPRGIATYPSFPGSRLPTTMSMTTTMTEKNRVQSHNGHSAKYTPPMPDPPAGRQIIVPRGITTYQSLAYRQFTTTMSTTTITTSERWNFHKWNSTHSRSSLRKAGYSAQRDYDWPIHSQKVIPDDYDRDNDNNK